jgi:hypothetical protein
MLLALSACSSLVCGPGTFEDDGQCLAVAAPAVDTADSAEPVDTVDSVDTDTAPPEPPPIQVYLLAGQSNMDGYGYLSGLPPEMQLADARVPLYWSGWGEFRPLAPASQGGQFYVGPEVSLGRALADAGQRVALVKHAVGGTDLAYYWYPGATPDAPDAGPGFSVLADTVDAAALALDAEGEPWEWAGFIWMQGESDSLDVSMTTFYASNLQGLLAAVREITDTPELPATIGLISRESYWTYADDIREAQVAVADADDFAVTVETDDLPRNSLDLAHYDGPSNRVLGERFARAVLEAADVPAGSDSPTAALTVSTGATDYDFTGTCGWEFALSEAVVVTDLGNFDLDYLQSSVDVGIWDADGNLVVKGNVASWVDAPTSWRSGVWYTAIDPVRLEPGTYRIGVVSWLSDGDRYLNNVTGRFARGVDYTGAVYLESYWLAYPSNHIAGASVAFVGPSFLFVPAE